MVAHGIDGVREIVVDGETGVLIRQPNFDGLRASMEGLIALVENRT